MSWSNPQVVGKVAGEGIVAELGDGLGHDVLVTVLLTQDYEPRHPPGYPFRIAHGVPLVPAGVVLDLVRPEAAALVAAGAATYGGQRAQPTEPPANVTAPYCGGPSGGDREPVGTTLSCTKGTWSNAEDVQTAYQWERDEETIEGATTDEYTTDDDDEDCALPVLGAGEECGRRGESGQQRGDDGRGRAARAARRAKKGALESAPIASSPVSGLNSSARRHAAGV